MVVMQTRIWHALSPLIETLITNNVPTLGKADCATTRGMIRFLADEAFLSLDLWGRDVCIFWWCSEDGD
jgi:hypothetical protein